MAQMIYSKNVFKCRGISWYSKYAECMAKCTDVIGGGMF
jgi:hypothetical protein